MREKAGQSVRGKDVGAAISKSAFKDVFAECCRSARSALKCAPMNSKHCQLALAADRYLLICLHENSFTLPTELPSLSDRVNLPLILLIVTGVAGDPWQSVLLIEMI